MIHRNIIALALMASPALAGVPCSALNRCTVVAAVPADPVTTQCIGDRARLLAENARQAQLITDLTARVQTAEAAMAEAEKPAPPSTKKHHRKRRTHK